MPKQQPKRRTPRQKRSRATVEAILEAAAEIFTETEIAYAGTRRIAERAGVGVGSFYEYYSGKDALVRALVQRFAEEIETEINAVFDERVDEPLEVMLPRLVRSAIAVHDKNSALHARLIRVIPQLPGENPLDVIEGPIRERFAALIAACNTGTIKDIDRVALVIVHASRRLIEAAAADERLAIDLKELEAELVTLSLSYLQGSTSAAP